MEYFGCAVIDTLGYGFGDEHINKMLRHGLRSDPTKRLVAVARCQADADAPVRAAKIATLLEVPLQSVQVIPSSAKAFLSRAGGGEAVRRLLPELPKAEF